MSKEELNIVANDPIDLDDDQESKPSEVPVKEDPLKEETPKESPKETAKEIPEEDAPPAPPRPVSPITSMKNNLKEAFPTISDRVITGVLIASQGNLDTSFNALLYISDETIEEPEIILAAAQPPVKPSRPSVAPSDDDEALARKLQKEFELEERRRRRHHKDAQRKQVPHDEDESPDEFEQFKETFNQGLNDARSTLNGWVSGIAKKLDGAGNEHESQSQQPKLFGALGGSSAATRTRRFDDDPEISNDFNSKIVLDDNDKAPELPKRTTNEWKAENVPVNSDAFMVTDSEEEDKKDIKL